MSMKEILFVTTSFPPAIGSGPQRVVRLLKRLPDVGYQATVLTTAPHSANHLPSLKELQIPGELIRVPLKTIRTMDGQAFRRQKPDSFQEKSLVGGTVVKAARNVRERLGYQLLVNLLEIPDMYNRWILPALRQGKLLCESNRFCCIYATAPSISAHIVAALLARKRHLPLILEYRDIWVGNPWGNAPWYLRQRLDRLIERWLINQASRIITISSGSANILARRYGTEIAKRLAVVSHGFEPAQFSAIPIVAATTQLPLTIVYTGILYSGRRDLTGFFKAVRLLLDECSLTTEELVIQVAGDADSMIAQANKFGISDIVKNLGRVSPLQALEIQKTSHILLLVEAVEDTEWVRSNLPGKLYEYLGARRPILALIHPESIMAQIIRDTNTGMVSHPNDVTQIADYLKRNIHQLRDGNDVNFQPNQHEVDKYSWENVIHQLAPILDQCTVSSE